MAGAVLREKRAWGFGDPTDSDDSEDSGSELNESNERTVGLLLRLFLSFVKLILRSQSFQILLLLRRQLAKGRTFALGFLRRVALAFPPEVLSLLLFLLLLFRFSGLVRLRFLL